MVGDVDEVQLGGVADVSYGFLLPFLKYRTWDWVGPEILPFLLQELYSAVQCIVYTALHTVQCVVQCIAVQCSAVYSAM